MYFCNVYLFWRESSFYNSVMQTNGGVQMRVVVDGDDDAVKFAERLLRFWRMNLLLDARLLMRRLCGQFS